MLLPSLGPLLTELKAFITGYPDKSNLDFTLNELPGYPQIGS
ncbi:Uncharacterized protein dnm_022360 [Desulfonema magnum]|uniref:Uncharacterized protein n=1 Tax=Desulfonema magnum TaxID=45655 RepID=A0A975BJF8_9BACT|nr:Uncharacterized protein dnm_022360 [Desulfonema magnum]